MPYAPYDGGYTAGFHYTYGRFQVHEREMMTLDLPIASRMR